MNSPSKLQSAYKYIANLALFIEPLPFSCIPFNSKAVEKLAIEQSTLAEM